MSNLTIIRPNPYFITPSTDVFTKVEPGSDDEVLLSNVAININLATSIVKLTETTVKDNCGELRYFADDPIYSIEFVFHERCCKYWVYETKEDRDADYIRIISIGGSNE